MRPAVLRFLSFSALASSLIACMPPCMKTGYKREARVTSEYQLVTTSAAGRVERRGFGPDRMTMHLYDAFRCSLNTQLPTTQPDSRFFYVDLGPECRLMVRADSHLRDTGRSASGDFIQSEAQLVEGGGCAMTLDDGHVVEGKVKHGTMVIRPQTVTLDVALDIEGGTFHLAQTGAWDGATPRPPTL